MHNGYNQMKFGTHLFVPHEPKPINQGAFKYFKCETCGLIVFQEQSFLKISAENVYELLQETVHKYANKDASKITCAEAIRSCKEECIRSIIT